VIARVDSGQPMPVIARHSVMLLVDDVDIATLRALRYARSLKPASLRAVHVAIDVDRAEQLARQWRTNSLSAGTDLELVDCPDRRLIRTVVELAMDGTRDEGTEVTLLMPRRQYSAILGRVLHDHTADKIASAVTRLPRVAATIVPFDVSRVSENVDPAARSQTAAANLRAAAERAVRGADPASSPATAASVSTLAPAVAGDHEHRDGIAAAKWRERVSVTGTVHSVRHRSLSSGMALAVELWDDTGGLLLLFYGRDSLPGIRPGARMRASGMVGSFDDTLAIANPMYELLKDK